METHEHNVECSGLMSAQIEITGIRGFDPATKVKFTQFFSVGNYDGSIDLVYPHFEQDETRNKTNERTEGADAGA